MMTTTLLLLMRCGESGQPMVHALFARDPEGRVLAEGERHPDDSLLSLVAASERIVESGCAADFGRACLGDGVDFESVVKGVAKGEFKVGALNALASEPRCRRRECRPPPVVEVATRMTSLRV